MPEGDTVWLTARNLDRALAGQRLTTSDFRVPALATADLVGHDVREVRARGKHILLRVSGDLTVHSHLRMDGSWHLYRPNARWHGGRPYEVRVVLATAQWSAVGYRVHDLAVVATGQEDDLVGHLGPDLLGPDWDLDEAVRRLATQPDRAVGEALLDQRNLAGIGNLYQCETLFLTGVSPWRRAGDTDLARVVAMARRLLVANRDRTSQVTTGVARRGEEHWVYERAGRPCRRCGTTVQTARLGEPPRDRPTYWCPSCQP
jgi:endonuclease VIII